MFVQELINTLVQLAVFTLIAWIVWLILARKRSGFRNYIGLVPPPARAVWLALALSTLFAAMTVAISQLPGMAETAAGGNTVAGSLKTHGLGGETLATLVLVALFKTALSEEILFRGLIAKRLISWLGFQAGNAVQALLFGAVHLLIFAIPGGPAFTPLLGAGVLLLPAAAGWLMAWANERHGAGSIVPGWIIHGLGNVFGYSLLAFML